MICRCLCMVVHSHFVTAGLKYHDIGPFSEVVSACVATRLWCHRNAVAWPAAAYMHLTTTNSTEPRDTTASDAPHRLPSSSVPPARTPSPSTTDDWQQIVVAEMRDHQRDIGQTPWVSHCAYLTYSTEYEPSDSSRIS